MISFVNQLILRIQAVLRRLYCFFKREVFNKSTSFFLTIIKIDSKKNVFIRYLSLLILLMTVGWFFWNPIGWTFDWEPLVAFVGALITFLGLDLSQYVDSYKSSTQVHPADMELFEALSYLLPSTKVAKFLKEQNFSGSYRGSSIMPLHTFVDEWNNVEHEFIDVELEELRKSLHDATKDFVHTLNTYSRSLRGDFYSIKPVDYASNYHPSMDLKRKQEGDEINSKADVVVEIHQKLFKRAREKLKKIS